MLNPGLLAFRAGVLTTTPQDRAIEIKQANGKCDNGSFKAIKGRKGKAEDETKDSKNESVQKVLILVCL